MLGREPLFLPARRASMTIHPLPSSRRADRIAFLQQNVERVIRGKSEVVQLCIAALLAKGHILLEDVPGVGKTMLAHALARSLSLSFQRIQFTSDLLPADIVGITIYKQEQQEFEFVSGPIFTNVLLADEINRATPKTQSALLEAMSEGMITIEKNRLPLPGPPAGVAARPLPDEADDRLSERDGREEAAPRRRRAGRARAPRAGARRRGRARAAGAGGGDPHERGAGRLPDVDRAHDAHARRGRPRRLDARRADVLQGLPGPGNGERPRLRRPRRRETPRRPRALAPHPDEGAPRPPRRCDARGEVHRAGRERGSGAPLSAED